MYSSKADVPYTEIEELCKLVHVKYDIYTLPMSLQNVITRVKQLQKTTSDYHWTVNPDRMGQ